MLEIKDQYVAVFVKTINKVVTIQGKKKFKVDAQHLTFRDKSYNVDTKTVSYRNKNKFIYMVDIDGGQQVIFENKEDKVKNPELANLIVEKKIVSQLVAGLVSVGKTAWFPLIICILMGLAFGYIMGNAIPLKP